MTSNPESTADLPPAARPVAARSHAYGLFARIFRYPDAETLAYLEDGRFAADLREAIALSRPSVSEDVEACLSTGFWRSPSIEDFAAAYLAAFENDVPRPSVSLYESSYGNHKDNRPALLLELKGFYRNFGLEMADNDIEDALPAELEFMQFAAAKQAWAIAEGGNPVPYLHAQRDFLSRHLAPWLPGFQAELERKLDDSLFIRVARLAVRYVQQDADEVEREFTAIRLA